MDTANSSFTANYASSVEKLGDKLPIGGKKAIGFILVVIFLMFTWSWISSPMIVNVSGVGEVTVPATNAIFSFTLTANDNSPQNAVNIVNQKADNITSFLLTKGVAEADIAEGQVTAVPAALVVTGAPGFQATISMAVKTVHVSEVSTLISDLYTNGVTVVSQPILSVENQEALENEALDKALKDAKKEAGIVGLKSWKFIRKVVGVAQTTSTNTSTATTKADTLTQSADAVAAQNGVFKIVKAVSVTYKMW